MVPFPGDDPRVDLLVTIEAFTVGNLLTWFMTFGAVG